MATKTIKLKEALDFARENGYLLAAYKRIGKGFLLHDDNFYINYNVEDGERDIVVKTTGACTDFNEFTTTCGQFCFRLHNNFNLPNMIPIFN
jgi:hypothetical protein